MSYKSLQQLRDEQQAHHNRAMRLLQKSAAIQKEMKTAAEISEFVKLQKQWLETDAQARDEIRKSIELTEQFIQELERLKNRNLN